MKKVWFNILIVLAVMSSCKNTPAQSSNNTPSIEKGEACSVKVSGVEFTKSLNGAKATAIVESDKLTV